MTILYHMPVYQTQVQVKGDLRLAEELTIDDYHFSPLPEGFGLAFSIEATSNETAKTASDSRLQLLMDCLTFAKGPSLQYHIHQITQVPGRDLGSQVATGQAFITARVHVVITEGRAGIMLGVDLTSRVTSHSKAEVLERVLRWYARGSIDTDSIDKFLDYWVALEALADSYEGKVQPHECQKCGHTVNPRLINGVQRAYLESLGMIEEAGKVSTLAQARGKLFHEGSVGALKYLSEVQAVLKSCVQKELA
jgi:hypothetical protein